MKAPSGSRTSGSRIVRKASIFIFTLLSIELIDELFDGASGALWPVLRDELALTYAQLGVLFSLPRIVGSILDLPMGVLADAGHRRPLVLAGGVCLAASFALVATATGFWWLLAGLLLFNPASGAFVGLSQATLMDVAQMDARPERRGEQLMTWWTLTGTAGALLGPIAIGAAMEVAVGWRVALAGLAAATLLLAVFVGWQTHSAPPPAEAPPRLLALLREAWQALKDRRAVRYLLLMEAGDFGVDLFLGFVALYLVDVGGVTPQQAAWGLSAWMVGHLVGNAAVAALLRRIDGLVIVRVSAALAIFAIPALLLAPPALRLPILALLGALTSSWYPVMCARFYALLPDRTGLALSVGSVAGLIGGLIPLLFGAVADVAGVEVVMWLLVAGPVALVLGLPRQRPS